MGELGPEEEFSPSSLLFLAPFSIDMFSAISCLTFNSDMMVAAAAEEALSLTRSLLLCRLKSRGPLLAVDIAMPPPSMPLWRLPFWFWSTPPPQKNCFCATAAASASFPFKISLNRSCAFPPLGGGGGGGGGGDPNLDLGGPKCDLG